MIHNEGSVARLYNEREREAGEMCFGCMISIMCTISIPYEICIYAIQKIPLPTTGYEMAMRTTMLKHVLLSVFGKN